MLRRTIQSHVVNTAINGAMASKDFQGPALSGKTDAPHMHTAKAGKVRIEVAIQMRWTRRVASRTCV
ncbi:MAG: hypothetical protein KDA53_03545 [Hyphomonas sp.]|nr:hypothetical protein [Hyphomonas sp.]